MASIKTRRIVVLPLLSGPGHVGNADADSVSYDAVPLTHGYLSSLGGAGVTEGISSGIRLGLKYRDSDGLLTALDLSGASGLVMHIWHRTTAEFVDNRTQDTDIGATGIKELEIDGDGTAGTITIVFHQSETLAHGLHHWAITGDWTLAEVLAAGTIEIRNALVTS